MNKVIIATEKGTNQTYLRGNAALARLSQAPIQQLYMRVKGESVALLSASVGRDSRTYNH